MGNVLTEKNATIDEFVNEFFEEGEVLEYHYETQGYNVQVKELKSEGLGLEKKYVIKCEYACRDILKITVESMLITHDGKRDILINVEENDVHTIMKGTGHVSNEIIKGIIYEMERDSNGRPAYNGNNNGKAKEFYIKKTLNKDFKYTDF